MITFKNTLFQFGYFFRPRVLIASKLLYILYLKFLLILLQNTT